MDSEIVEIYDKLISLTPNVEKKGKNMLYTSANGYMFSLINKEGQMGIRLPKELATEFIEKYDSGEFRSHGAVMRDYVLVTDPILNDLETLASYLTKSHEYVCSLKPK